MRRKNFANFLVKRKIDKTKNPVRLEKRTGIDFRLRADYNPQKDFGSEHTYGGKD